jgi:hypothetical protein
MDASFDMLGRRVATLANGPLTAGTHQFTFDGGALATGVYLYHLTINGKVQTGKMTLLK